MANQHTTETNENLSPRADIGLNAQDQEDILADRDQTASVISSEDERRGGNGPASMDLEDEPSEFVRGEIDVKTQMDRTIRIARADARGHHDLDDSPDMTPGGIEEVAAKTDEDLARQGKGRPARAPVPEQDPGEISRTGNRIDISELEEEVDLASDGLDAGTMNEEDARETGYLTHDDRLRLPQHAHEKGHPTGAYTDIGAGRSSVVHARDDDKDRRPH